MIKYCGTAHCDLAHKSQDICEQCQFYVPLDSGSGNCFGVPPETVMTLKFPGRIKYEQKIKVVPWCMLKCGIFKKRKEK